MSLLIILLIIIAAGLVFTELSARFQVPYVTALIISGIIFGTSGLNIIEVTEEIDFLGEIGVIFLMFLAGASIDISAIGKSRKDVGLIATMNSVIPFITGFLITYLLTDDISLSFLMGIIFISSAIAVILPSLERLGLSKTHLGNTIVATTVIEDMLSLTLLAVFIQQSTHEDINSILLSLIIISFLLVILRGWIGRFIIWVDKYEKTKNIYESRLRFVLVILFASVALFEIIGLNAIIASFVAGILVGDYVSSKHLEEKIKTISYGIFVPIFFFIIGVQTDLAVFQEKDAIITASLVVTGLVLSKVISGYIGARLAKLPHDQSLFLGVATTPQLSTTLAVAFTASAADLIPREFLTAIVILTIATATISPFIVNSLGARLSKHTKSTRTSDINKVTFTSDT
jgi:Kef-type K+ transport system membrane component KefB